MIYRPEIDGLRAIAALSILLFHADFFFLKGGFLGVDIFFVISGYLISSIILNEKHFSFKNFYIRRIQRIIPVLYFVLFVSFIASIFIILPYDLKAFKSFLKSIIVTPIFSSNFLFWKEIGYFDIASHYKPLLHTWSLSIEEQFYIIFPIFFILVLKLSFTKHFFIIIILALFSFLLAIYGSYKFSSANFFLLPSRAWELLVGVLITIILNSYKIQLKKKYSNLLSFIGLILIIFSITYFDDNHKHPGLITLIPVVGTFIIIIATSRTTNFVKKILSFKPLVYIGLMSYSIYLWHQPIFSFYRHYSYESITYLTKLILILITLLISYFSWKIIEIPFRSKKNISTKNIFSITTLASLLFIVIGFMGLNGKVYEKLYLSYLEDREKNIFINSRDQKYEKNCVFRTDKLDENFKRRFLRCSKIFDKTLIILGDSHAIEIFQGISINSKSNFIVGLTQGGCRPYSKDKICNYENFLKFINNNKHEISQVLFHQSGFHLLKSSDDVQIMDFKKTILIENYLSQIDKSIKVIWLGPYNEPNHNVKLSKKLAYNCIKINLEFDEKLKKSIKQLDINLKNMYQNSNKGIEYMSYIDNINFNEEIDLYNCNSVFWINGDHWSFEGEKYFGSRVLKYLISKNVLLR